MKSRTKIWLAGVAVLLAIGMVPAVQAAADPNQSPALCGSADTPETGIQGDGTNKNCGITFLSAVPGGGAVQGAGHCAYVRSGTQMLTYSLANPEVPVQVDSDPLYGGSESFRTKVANGRAIMVSGRGVYDITNCENPVFKGEIQWPSNAPQIAATNSHELAISHDARRVYTGLGFAIAYLDNLEDPSTWRVYNHTCALGRQACQGPTCAAYPQHAGVGPTLCDVAPQGDYSPQFSHSSDDNLEGTRWYGANQNGDQASQLEPSTARVVNISQRGNPVVLDKLPEFPGHGLDWWRSPNGKEFIVGSNELGAGDRCAAHPRSTALTNSFEAYVAEVTNDDLKHANLVRLMINEPQNCTVGSGAVISEHSVYNEHGAAMLMMEWGAAGVRVFDVRDGYNPKEVAYFNRGGHVHSGRFHYDDKRGIMLEPASSGMRVLELQPQVIQALGLPTPTDPLYPRYPNGRPATP